VTEGAAGLRRTLTRGDIVFAVIGNVIGSGIFLVPAETLRVAGGSTAAALMVWVLGGALCLLGALTYAELGAANPEAGGIYCHVRDAFGPLPAFLYGWVLFLIIGPATVAALAVASVAYLGQLVNLGSTGGRVLSVAMILAIGAINVAGARESANVQNASAALKAGALVVLAATLIVLGRFGVFETVPGAAPPELLGGVGAAMVGVLWAYEGWQWVTFSAGETQDPRRAFPFGLVVGTAVLIAIYLLVNAGYFMALGPAAAQGSTSIAADAVAATVGPGMGKVIAALVVLATFSAAHSSVLTVPRVFYQMARDGLFFQKLAEVHPRFGTPAWAVLSTTALSVVYALSGTFDQLLTAVVFTAWAFYGLGATAIFVFHRRAPDAHRPFRIPGYPYAPALFVAASAGVVVNTLCTQTAVSAVGLGVLLLGIPAYYAWRRRTIARPLTP
jgi:APA family basic amino acid/polyamine antiporter